jgi:hypothetical protein
VLLPWGSLFIESSLAPDAAAARLSDRIGAGLDWKPLVWATTVNIDGGREFRFRRRIQYRNSFLPDVRARVEGRDGGGSRIRIRMCPPVFLGVVWVAWLGGALFIGVPGAIACLRSGEPGWIGFALPALTAVLFVGGFAVEAAIAERLLLRLFAESDRGR